MKKNFLKSFIVISAGIFFLGGTGCRKLEDFGDINVNPNGSPDVLTSALLTNVQAGLGGNVADLNTGHYAQIFAEPQYPGNSLYVLPNFNSAGLYSGPLMDLQTIITKNTDPATAGRVVTEGANASQIAIARILKAYYFWTITDRWGDVPYFDALKGTANLTPKYDSQELIYKDLLKELKEAKNQFDAAGAIVKGDIIYNGDISKWQKLSNTLRMLISMRMSKVYPNDGGLADLEFTDAINSPEGFIDNNSKNFTLVYPSNPNFRNSFYNFSLSADNGTSKTLTDLMGALSDTRGTAFYSSSVGVPYGLSSTAPSGVTYGKIMSTTWHAVAAPIVIINAASALLAKAEAIQRGWITGDAKAAYDAGVTASFEQWGVAMPSNYLTTGPANFNSGVGVASIGGVSVPGSSALTPTALSRIHLQQFIAFYPSGIQVWSNWRRTGVPNLQPTINARGGSGIVRRYVYGPTEENLNGEQLKIAIAAIPGGDDQDSRVWWDRP